MTPSPDPVDKPAPLHREESTTPDPVERGHRFLEAANRRDFDAALSFFAPDAVWEARAFGTTFEGVAAISGFWEDGCPKGSAARVQARHGDAWEWVQGKIVRITSYLDIDKGRAAAERLAASRE